MQIAVCIIVKWRQLSITVPHFHSFSLFQRVPTFVLAKAFLSGDLYGSLIFNISKMSNLDTVPQQTSEYRFDKPMRWRQRLRLLCCHQTLQLFSPLETVTVTHDACKPSCRENCKAGMTRKNHNYRLVFVM